MATCAAAADVVLLVDADTHSVEEIRKGVALVTQKYGVVKTSVFAEPRRLENTKWRQFLQEPGMEFRPVPRQVLGEANDREICVEMQYLAESNATKCIALLVSDKDFFECVRALVLQGQELVVLVPSVNKKALWKYEELGVPVLELHRVGAAPKVRAVLEADGNGSVRLADAWVSRENRKEVNGLAKWEFP